MVSMSRHFIIITNLQLVFFLYVEFLLVLFLVSIIFQFEKDFTMIYHEYLGSLLRFWDAYLLYAILTNLASYSPS